MYIFFNNICSIILVKKELMFLFSENEPPSRTRKCIFPLDSLILNPFKKLNKITLKKKKMSRELIVILYIDCQGYDTTQVTYNAT